MFPNYRNGVLGDALAECLLRAPIHARNPFVILVTDEIEIKASLPKKTHVYFVNSILVKTLNIFGFKCITILYVETELISCYSIFTSI